MNDKILTSCVTTVLILIILAGGCRNSTATSSSTPINIPTSSLPTSITETGGTTNPPTAEPTSIVEPVPVSTEYDPDAGRGLSSVDEETEVKLIRIALDNPTIQEIVKALEFQLHFGEQTIVKKHYELTVGVILKEGTDLPLGEIPPDDIEKFAGFLHVGYGGQYFLTFDRIPSVLTKIVFISPPSSTIPELTSENMQAALNIAWADPSLQKLLEGKVYEVAPDNKIGVWHEGMELLGIGFTIDFDKSYAIKATLPVSGGEPQIFDGEGKSLNIMVNLKEGIVATITVLPF